MPIFRELIGPFPGPYFPWIGYLIVLAVLALIARLIGRGDTIGSREAWVLSLILVLAFVAIPIIELVAR